MRLVLSSAQIVLSADVCAELSTNGYGAVELVRGDHKRRNTCCSDSAAFVLSSAQTANKILILVVGASNLQFDALALFRIFVLRSMGRANLVLIFRTS